MVGWRGWEWSWRGLLAAVLLSGPALAQEQVAEAQPVSPEAPEGVSTDVPAPKKAKKPKTEPLGENPDAADDSKDERTLRVFGRVFARASADQRDEYSRSLSLPSARVGVNAGFENIEAEVSADLSSK